MACDLTKGAVYCIIAAGPINYLRALLKRPDLNWADAFPILARALQRGDIIEEGRCASGPRYVVRTLLSVPIEVELVEAQDKNGRPVKDRTGTKALWYCNRIEEAKT
jgi:hypothetical protein